jgi:hypothetical protein
MRKVTFAFIIVLIVLATAGAEATPALQLSPLPTPVATLEPGPYPTPDWDQLTPGVDYEASRISVQLPLDVSHRLIMEYFNNGQVLTRTGIASLDAIGQRYGLIKIEPATRMHAREVYIALSRGQPDPYPPLSDGFHLVFTSSINVQAMVDDYKADPSVLWANPVPIYQLEGGPTMIIEATSLAAATPAPTMTTWPAQTVEPLERHEGTPARRVSVWLAIGACCCLATSLAVATAIAVALIRRRHAASSARNALQK